MNKIPYIYLLILGISLLILESCYKDKSVLGSMKLPPAEVDGIDSIYRVYTHQDTLRISPKVSNENRYNFSWFLYSASYNNIGGLVPTPDTLSLTKELDYVVDKDPGEYILLFNVQDKETLVTNSTRMQVSISTLTMNGWYLLKDDGARTDFDFIHSGGRIDNWIATFNEGKNLDGKAIKAIFVPAYKDKVTSTDSYGALAAISDQDAAILRIDNGAMVTDFDHMFFTKPAVKKPQDIFQPANQSVIGLINDEKYYNMYKGTQFANSSISNYRFASQSAVVASVLLFDKNSKSMVMGDNGNFLTFKDNGNDLKGMDADLVWMSGYTSLRNVAVTLFKKLDTGEGLLYRLNGAFQYLNGGSSPLIELTATIPANHGLLSADKICGNYDADYLYYAKGNQIYMTDFASLQESLQVTLSEGEEVTCMQHVKYPQPATGVVNSLNYIAIATYKNGKYKIWLYPINSIGGLRALSQPNFEGDGRVNCVIYMENGQGSRVF